MIEHSRSRSIEMKNSRSRYRIISIRSIGTYTSIVMMGGGINGSMSEEPVT